MAVPIVWAGIGMAGLSIGRTAGQSTSCVSVSVSSAGAEDRRRAVRGLERQGRPSPPWMLAQSPSRTCSASISLTRAIEILGGSGGECHFCDAPNPATS